MRPFRTYRTIAPFEVETQLVKAIQQIVSAGIGRDSQLVSMREYLVGLALQVVEVVAQRLGFERVPGQRHQRIKVGATSRNEPRALERRALHRHPRGQQAQPPVDLNLLFVALVGDDVEHRGKPAAVFGRITSAQ